MLLHEIFLAQIDTGVQQHGAHPVSQHRVGQRVLDDAEQKVEEVRTLHIQLHVRVLQHALAHFEVAQTIDIQKQHCPVNLKKRDLRKKS